MKLYKVKVNGKVYEVEVEACETVDKHIEQPKAQVNETAPNVTGTNTIVAPIAGKVLSIKVNVGDTVSKGQTVAIIEAMKLENEIQSAFDGVVKGIKVNVGDSVKNKDELIILG